MITQAPGRRWPVLPNPTGSVGLLGLDPWPFLSLPFPLACLCLLAYGSNQSQMTYWCHRPLFNRSNMRCTLLLLADEHMICLRVDFTQTLT